jgi:16S rRNA (cytidine1402-2'-O)-methyltransferase
MLYLVSTPIGNMEDITFRAIKTLTECDYVLAEDTRRTGQLLKHFNISKPLVSFNEFSEKRKAAQTISDLKDGKTIALVSDSGTPGISDPGFFLVRECIKEGIQVSPVPGACALISGLICSGLPTDKFKFYGFIAKHPEKRKECFLRAKKSEFTSIFYESPHRIGKTLKELSIIMPENKIVIARELTKKFEEFISGTALEVYERIKDKNLKGEIVLLVSRI